MGCFSQLIIKLSRNNKNHFSGPIESWYFADIMVLRGYERETGSLFVTLTGAGNVIGRAIGAVLRFYVK